MNEADLPERDVRRGVDLIFARLEDSMTSLNKFLPLNVDEASHLIEIADWLSDKARKTVERGR